MMNSKKLISDTENIRIDAWNTSPAHAALMNANYHNKVSELLLHHS